jgi:[ribosomal protein S18]-alanine N-acetyltransferase
VRAAAEIRLIRPEEHRELRQIRLKALAYTSQLAAHLATEEAAPPEFWIKRAAEGSAADKLATFVAVRDGILIGIADGYMSEQESRADIGGMWVARDARRSGVGSALVTALCAWAQTKGARTIRLHVRKANEAAVRLYEERGFAIADEATSESGSDGFVMEKPLQADVPHFANPS